MYNAGFVYSIYQTPRTGFQHHHHLYIYEPALYTKHHTNKILFTIYIRNTTPMVSSCANNSLFTAPVLPGTTCAHPNKSLVPVRAAVGPPVVTQCGLRGAGGPWAACGTASRQGGTGWEAAHWEEGRWWARWPVCACWRRGGMRRSSNLSANNKQ